MNRKIIKGPRTVPWTYMLKAYTWKRKILQEITKEIPNLVTIVDSNIYTAIIPNKKKPVIIASGKELLVWTLNSINHENPTKEKGTYP